MPMKHLQKHMKKHLKTIANIHNIQTKYLQHMCENICNIQNHTCNMRLKNQMKH
jgi:hypothetical protein